MADMTFQEVERAAQQKLPVLFPVAVIEEHGPHMPLGTDAYLTYSLCKRVRQGLLDMGADSLIAPPYYWGINVATGGFAGTFTVRPETMVSVLFDLLECLKSWGFENIFFLNVHGDFKHIATMAGAAKKVHEELGIGAYCIVPDLLLKGAGLTGHEPYVIVERTKPVAPSEYLDLHSGGSETSLMLNAFPELVDIDTARTLESSKTTFKDLKTWLQGGEKAREVTPLGYCGNPSAIDVKEARTFELDMAQTIAGLIFEVLQRKQASRIRGQEASSIQ